MFVKGGRGGTCQRTEWGWRGASPGCYFGSFPHQPSVQHPCGISVLSKDAVRWPGMLPRRWMNSMWLIHRSRNPTQISQLPCWFQLPLHPPPSKHTENVRNFFQVKKMSEESIQEPSPGEGEGETGGLDSTALKPKGRRHARGRRPEEEEGLSCTAC